MNFVKLSFIASYTLPDNNAVKITINLMGQTTNRTLESTNRNGRRCKISETVSVDFICQTFILRDITIPL